MIELTCFSVFGVIRFLGPIGAGFRDAYFVGKASYEYISGDPLSEKPE